MITDVFLDQKRVNVREHMVKTVPYDSFGKFPPQCVQGRKGEEWRRWGKIGWKSSEVNTRAVSRGKNEVIDKLKMMAGVGEIWYGLRPEGVSCWDC